MYRSRVGLIGASLTDYDDLEELCHKIIHLGGKVSICSLRIDDISDTLLGLLAASGTKTITLAPEAGTQRLRNLIGKADITDEKILTATEQIIKWGCPNLKLYFMIGLPQETKKDLDGIIEIVKKIRHQVFQTSKGKQTLRQITISISSFIPKPLTKFQFYPMESIETLNKKIRYISQEARSLRYTKCIHDLPKWSFVQALLSRGDRRVSEMLYLALQEKGNWNKALRKLNINPYFYVYRYFEKGEIYPWNLWMK